MSDDAARAARMYPSMASAASTTQSATPVVAAGKSDSAPPAGVMSPPGGDVSTNSEALSEAEKELERGFRMYPPEMALKHVQPVWPVEMSAEQQTQLTAAVRTELGRKLMLGPDEATTIVNAVSAFNQTDPSAEQQATWRSQSETKLRAMAAQHGTSTAQLLADANAYLKRSPLATEMLAKSKLLNHPDILTIAVERSRTARRKGLLK